MNTKEFLTVYSCFEDIETIRSTLPSIVEETLATDSALIIHDCSVKNRHQIRAFIEQYTSPEVFCIFTSPIGQARARNMAIEAGISLFAPSILCCVEDDHGFRSGFIEAMRSTVKAYYGKTAPNGMKFGLFSGCMACWKDYSSFKLLATGHAYPTVDEDNPLQGQAHYGGTNACCHCAPIQHWQSVLGRYDIDEYPISYYQTGHINVRNYHQGFTGMTVAGGKFMFETKRKGRGHTESDPAKRPFVSGMSDSHIKWLSNRNSDTHSDEPWSRQSSEHKSQLGQDHWVATRTNYKENGFFVEIGATNGIELSNTYYLEKVLGWQGICVEPNPHFFDELQTNRDCHVSNACIGGKTGEKVDFLLAAEYGGLAQFAHSDLHADKRADECVERIQLTTKSLNDVLDEYDAPRCIDYLSIDTEGSEFLILHACDLQKWDIAMITVEHNWTRQRAKIFNLLTKLGYTRLEREWDDWYYK